MKPRRILFLQLPQLDNDVRSQHENVPLAAAYLTHALRRSPEHRFYRAMLPPPGNDTADDAHLLAEIEAIRPDILAATLYLWNIERTLHILKLARERLPGIRILAGGPEVAIDHPFLFRNPIVDVAVTGEGEVAFPMVLGALRRNRTTNLTTVAWRSGRTYRWGRRTPPTRSLVDVLPPASANVGMPTSAGLAYIETSRGCAWRCAFCCYNQRRRGVSFVPAADVVRRVQTLRRRGAREIRFVDPTLNSHPEFDAMVRGLARLNRSRRLEFFAEMRADLLTPEQCRRLARANFKDIEAGVQSTSSAVLNRIRRPTDLEAVERGIRSLAAAGITTTLDIMCGLPGQNLADLNRSLRWAGRLPRIDLQFLHTLLLPGTELRRNRRRWGLQALPTPPYRVTQTPELSAADIRQAEQIACRVTKSEMDSRADVFAWLYIPDLFGERIVIDLDRRVPNEIPGQSNRRALIFRGSDLWSKRNEVRRMVRQAIRTEPHILWQFVLSPITEEPLDLVDLLRREIDLHPRHFLDGMTFAADRPVRAARRVFILLRRNGRYSRAWVNAAERLLAVTFH